MPKGPATRDRILAQALKDASLLGLEGISIGRVAGELGMSKSGLFAHFGSKEELQIQVLTLAAERFTDIVLRPALAAPRGAPRVRALFEGWLRWEADGSVPGGCVFSHAAMELDDHPGPLRDALADWQRQWRDVLCKAATIAMEEKHFRRTLVPEQFAFQMFGIALGYHHAKRLLQDPLAEAHARAAFESLIRSAAA